MGQLGRWVYLGEQGIFRGERALEIEKRVAKRKLLYYERQLKVLKTLILKNVINLEFKKGD